MKIHGTDIKYKQAPLPFLGQKKRYIKQFQKILERIPYNSTVFDAFGGSSLLARIAKDTRPDLYVITNDYEQLYRNRLAVVDDTNRVLKELWEAGAYRNNNEYSRYDAETEKRLKEIVKTGKDEITCLQQIYTKNSSCTIRAVCRTVLYDVELCAHWYDGLNVLNSNIEKDIYKTDVYILDPPYKKVGITKIINQYSDTEISIPREFCAECIKNERKIILFDEIDSDLIELFMELNKGKFDAYIPKRAKGIYCKDMMITNIVE